MKGLRSPRGGRDLCGQPRPSQAPDPELYRRASAVEHVVNRFGLSDLTECSSWLIPSHPRRRRQILSSLEQILLSIRDCRRSLRGRWLARNMHKPPAETADLAVFQGVPGSRTLRRTDKDASGPSSCGCRAARPAPRSRCGVSCIMWAREGDEASHAPVCHFSPSGHRALQAFGKSDKRLSNGPPGGAF
jgi:hypothetical protein